MEDKTDIVYCDECKKHDWCAVRQYIKYSLGIEKGHCDAAEKREENA